jgi:ubiquitin-conjugating enzyme E2 W
MRQQRNIRILLVLQQLLLLVVVVVVAAANTLGSRSSIIASRYSPLVHSHFHSHRSVSLSASSSSMTTCLSIPRGGAKIAKNNNKNNSSTSTTTNNNKNAITKMIQSMLKRTKKVSPALYNILYSFFTSIEQLTGVTLLLPKQKKKKNHDDGNKNKKKRNKTTTTEDAVETETVVKRKAKSSTKKSSKKQPRQQKQVLESKNPTLAHLSSKLQSNNPNYRIQRELKEFLRDPPANLSVKVGSNIRIWIITMVGAVNTVYEGETYKLRVMFPPGYPTVPPSVYFLPPPPLHEHVYTNGDICLSLLGKDWKPTMTAQSIALSILSILSSASTKSLPMDNSRHSQNKPGQYQKDWVYHDDNC